jgi:drug/metabolite transporter (DMT)-like permease
MFAGCYGALAWAEQRVASGLAALLSAMTPFWFTAFEWTSGSRPNIRTAAGLFIGLVGVVLLVSGGAGAPLHAGPVAAILGGTVAWTLGSLYARPPRLPRSLALSAGMPLLAGGLLLLVASWTTHELTRFRVDEVSAKSAIALAYLVVFGSLVAFTAYAWLLRVAPPSRVATHAYVNPLVAVALGAALAGEPITATAAVAGLVIAGGVAMTLAGGRIHV